MMKQPNIDWEILDRYFRHEALPEEVASVQAWRADPETAKWLDSMREIWDAANVASSTSSSNVDNAWRALAARIDVDSGNVPVAPVHVRPAARWSEPIRRSSRRARVWGIGLGIAATLLLAAGVTLLQRPEPPEPPLATNPDTVPGREFATRRAQRADIYLSDGTHVILNVESKLQLAADYGQPGGSRDVTLVGEAFFEVAPDSLRPFTVRTSSGVVEDISTAFVVGHYPEARSMKVAVTSGSVIVSARTPSAFDTLVVGELARVDGAGRISVQHGIDMRRELAWTTGTLVLDRMPLRDVVARLSRWTDAEIRLGDTTLANVRYTATVRNETAAHVLELLAASLDARIERNRAGAYVIYSARK